METLTKTTRHPNDKQLKLHARAGSREILADSLIAKSMVDATMELLTHGLDHDSWDVTFMLLHALKDKLGGIYSTASGIYSLNEPLDQ